MCGLEARGSVRAFIAIELPEGIRQKLMALEKEIASAGSDVKLVEFENLHVTMKFLGDVSEASIERIAKVMGEVKAKPYQLRVKGNGVFPNNRMVRVLWAGTAEGKEETVSIFRQLDEKLAQMGFPRERDFTPHITIGRVRSQRNREQLLNALDRNKEIDFGIANVSKLALKKSILGSSGPIYSNLREIEFEP